MRAPESLLALIEQGVIDEVVRPLMSGKEAQVYLVVADGERYVAKIYKEAKNRTFKHRSEYTEGRRVRNTRDQRAMRKHSHYGRSQEEAAWRTAEVDAIYRLRDAGVRVPEPRAYIDNVLVMELVSDRRGNPAPRLADVPLPSQNPKELFEKLLRDVVKMLCAGLVHGDLSEFNILAGADESVIIDFPQVVDAAANRNARQLLIRDVDNLTRFFERRVPGLRSSRYGAEIWDLYERGELTPESVLTGRFRRRGRNTDVTSLLAEMDELEREYRPRREITSLASSTRTKRPRRQVVVDIVRKPARTRGPARSQGKRTPAANRAPTTSGAHDAAQKQPRDATEQPRKAPRPSRRRRRRRRPAATGAPATSGTHNAAHPQQQDATGQPRKSPPPSRRRRGRGQPAAKGAPATSGTHNAAHPQQRDATEEPRKPSSSSRRRRRSRNRRRKGERKSGTERSKEP